MTINLTDLIYQKKNALTRDQAQFLIEEYQKLEKAEAQLEHCPDAVTGEDTFSSYQRVSLHPGTEAIELVYKLNEQLINEYMDYLDSFKMFHVLMRNTMVYSHMYRLLKYEKGNKIHPHIDHSPYIHGSATFNLNDDYTGGDFVFWRGKHRVKLEALEAMIWPADHFWVHEVEEITSGVRYSTNSFLQSISESVKEHIMGFAEKKIYQEKLTSMNGRKSLYKYNIRKPNQE
jgi:hypothetical protein